MRSGLLHERASFGARPSGDGTDVRVRATRAARVTLVLETGAAAGEHAMRRVAVPLLVGDPDHLARVHLERGGADAPAAALLVPLHVAEHRDQIEEGLGPPPEALPLEPAVDLRL